MHILKRWTFVLGERMSRGVCPAGEVMKGHHEAYCVPHSRMKRKKARENLGRKYGDSSTCKDGREESASSSQ